MCQYDRRHFSRETVRDALRAHPVVVLSDGVRPNHFYEAPELFLNGHAADRRVEWMVSRLRGERPADARPTVMLAEEDRDISAGMKRTLLAMGYRVVKAEDAEEALEVARRERPGLVLTNTDLHWLDELISLAGQEAALRFVPVAAVYPNRPDEYSEDLILVLDDYSLLGELLPATVPDAR